MRPSLRKGAYAALSSPTWKEIRVRSGRDDTSGFDRKEYGSAARSNCAFLVASGTRRTKQNRTKQRYHPDRSVAQWRDLLFLHAALNFKEFGRAAPVAPPSDTPQNSTKQKRGVIPTGAYPDFLPCWARQSPRVRPSVRKAHEVYQRYQVQQEIRGSVVEGPAVLLRSRIALHESRRPHLLCLYGREPQSCALLRSH
jgi:hypothetical protein